MSQNKHSKAFLIDNGNSFEEVGINNPYYSLSNISKMAQTSDGYIWLATRNGLLRYNGLKIELITDIKDSIGNYGQISSLLEDKKGGLWIGTQWGLYYKTANELKFYSREEGFPRNYISSLYLDKGDTLWIGMSGTEICRIIEGKVSKFNIAPQRNVCRIIKGRDNDIWFGTIGFGVFCYSNGNIIKKYSRENGLSNSFVTSMFYDSRNTLWVGTRNGLNIIHDGKIKILNVDNGLKNNIISCILEDYKGNIWIATEGGLHLYKDDKISIFTTKDGLSNDLINYIFEDKENNLWICAHGSSLNRLKKQNLNIFNTRNGLSGSWIWSIYEDQKGRTWIGTNSNGVDVISNGKITNYSSRNGLPATSIRTFGEDKFGNLWIGTGQNGLVRFNGTKFTIFDISTGLPGNSIRAIYLDRKGTLWIGASQCLIRLDNNVFKTVINENDLNYNTIRCISEDLEGNLLIGTNAGLFIYRDGKYRVLGKKDGLSDSIIFSLLPEKDGTLWIGTFNNGLNRIKDGKITKYTTNDGLIDKTIYSILDDKLGNLWISCNFGIYSISKSDLNKKSEDSSYRLKISVYEKEEGTSTLECNGGNQHAGIRLKNGEMWFSSLSGVAVINPLKIEHNLVPPVVKIEKFRANNTDIPITDNMTISSDIDNLEFHFVALSFVNSRKNKYKYKLEGFDKDWLDVGSQTIAYYSKLPPGYYTFRVIACNNEGVWNESGDEVKFYIKPLFYQTVWLYFILAFILLGATSLIYRLRIRIYEKRKKEMEVLIEERTKHLEESQLTIKSLTASRDKFFSIITHDMKNLFTALLYYTGNLYENHKKISHEKLEDYIEKINFSSKSLYDSFSNLLNWSKIQIGKLEINPVKVDLHNLFSQNFQFIFDYAKKNNIQIQNDIEEGTIVFADFNMLIIIFQNLVFNAIKFNKPGGKVSIFSENRNDSHIAVTVKDNGIGMKREELNNIFNDASIRDISGTAKEFSTALGLVLCKELIEKNGGNIFVESEPGKGSAFTFTIPSYTNNPVVKNK